MVEHDVTFLKKRSNILSAFLIMNSKEKILKASVGYGKQNLLPLWVKQLLIKLLTKRQKKQIAIKQSLIKRRIRMNKNFVAS